MSECVHDITDQDEFADGHCPICMAAEIARLRREKEVLVEALEPFAKIADDYAAADSRRSEIWKDEGVKYRPHEDTHRVGTALGDCRAARAALRSATETKDRADG